MMSMATPDTILSIAAKWQASKQLQKSIYTWLWVLWDWCVSGQLLMIIQYNWTASTLVNRSTKMFCENVVIIEQFQIPSCTISTLHDHYFNIPRKYHVVLTMMSWWRAALEQYNVWWCQKHENCACTLYNNHRGMCSRHEIFWIIHTDYMHHTLIQRHVHHIFHTTVIKFTWRFYIKDIFMYALTSKWNLYTWLGTVSDKFHSKHIQGVLIDSCVPKSLDALPDQFCKPPILLKCKKRFWDVSHNL